MLEEKPSWILLVSNHWLLIVFDTNFSYNLYSDCFTTYRTLIYNYFTILFNLLILLLFFCPVFCPWTRGDSCFSDGRCWLYRFTCYPTTSKGIISCHHSGKSLNNIKNFSDKVKSYELYVLNKFSLLQDNLSRGNLGAVRVLQDLFPEPGRLQFIYADLGDAKSVSLLQEIICWNLTLFEA